MGDFRFGRAAEADRRFARYVPFVLDRLIALSRNPTLQRVGDVLLAVAIFLGSLADIFTHRQASGWGGPRPLELLAALLVSAPLLWRRRYPIAVLALVFAGGLINVALVAPRQAGFEPFVALIVAYYSLGAHETERRSLAAYVISVVAGAAPAAFINHTPGNAAPMLVWTFAAWLIGRIIRSWRERAIALERANGELEEQRELQAQAAVAVERGRIARELHDVVAHAISVTVVQARGGRRVLDSDVEQARTAFDSIERTGEQALGEMRRLLGMLREEDPDAGRSAPQPSLARLDALADDLRSSGLPVDVAVDGDAVELAPGVDLAAYRIVQEALTNTLKHAGPAVARVHVHYGRTAIELTVLDDGTGAGNGNGTGNGLVGIRERVAVVGGTIEAGALPEGGFRVHARLPYGDDE